MTNRTVSDLTRMIGVQSTILLMRQFGGRTLSVPTIDKMHELHQIVVTVGYASAQALAKKYGGQTINLPAEVNALLQIRNDEIVRRFVGGESIRSLAIFFGIDRRMAHKIIDAYGHRETRLSRSVTNADDA